MSTVFLIEPGQTVKLGMGAPLTGDYASFGVDISQGAAIAVTDAGTVDGFSFELVAQDTQGAPEGGAAVANKLATDPTVVAIPGHIFSGSTEAAIPIYEKAGMPMMSPSATNPPLTSLGSKVFNRVAFTDAVQGQFAADYLYNKLGFTKIAVLHDGGAYGQGLADVVKDACEETNDFKFFYPNEMKLRERVDKIAQVVYGADGAAWTPEAETKAKAFEADNKYDEYATMMVKTHLSLTHDPALKGVPKGWTLPIRDVLIYSGAKFLCPCAGAISLMPGTSSDPAFRRIDVDVNTGKVQGVF